MKFFVQIGLKMEAGDCPPLNLNAMRAVSVKSYLKKCPCYKLGEDELHGPLWRPQYSYSWISY